MNRRKIGLIHPQGNEVITPLLVPSYSSKGFALDDGKSELCNIMKFAKEFIYEAQLISAYDIFYKHMELEQDCNSTQITLIDSGGYETSNNFDLSETRKYDRSRKEWNMDLYSEVLNKWSDLYPAIIVSFDDVKIRKPIAEQISDATLFFNKHKGFLTNFLIKPNSDLTNFVNILEVIDNIDELNNFNIIGVTEKELGDSLYLRMKNIFLLNEELQNRNMAIPIHIFGALDPLSVVLYYLVGADIFDGLSWLKYDFFNGMATYTNNSSIVKDTRNIFQSDVETRLQTIKSNIYKLEKLKEILFRYTLNQNFDVFNELGNPDFGKLIDNIMNNFNKKV